jgi:hypothetical protein
MIEKRQFMIQSTITLNRNTIFMLTGNKWMEQVSLAEPLYKFTFPDFLQIFNAARVVRIRAA